MTKCDICGKKFSFLNSYVVDNKTYCSECYNKLPKLEEKFEKERNQQIKKEELEKKKEMEEKKNFKLPLKEILKKMNWWKGVGIFILVGLMGITNRGNSFFPSAFGGFIAWFIMSYFYIKFKKYDKTKKKSFWSWSYFIEER
ncbi:MAG: hypothetical protein Q7R52_03580 [archaeon]|nr:hypothetical protein [archaeon]